jgi:hypothetical protein
MPIVLVILVCGFAAGFPLAFLHEEYSAGESEAKSFN